MNTLSRRTLGKQALGSVLTFSILESLFARDAFADNVKPLVNKWVADLDALGQDVKGQKISQIIWQQKMEELYSQVNLPELLKLVNFEKLTKNIKIPDNGAKSLGFKFPEVEGIPSKLVFGQQIFALKKDRSVVPHGHNNMATAFLILGGELHGRHYDRLEDEKEHIIIRPTIDRTFKPAEYSTVSDYKDNIHWFKATSDVAYIFNIHVMDTQPDSAIRTGRIYLNPNGEQLTGGLIRAPRMGHTESHKLFG
jgi:hypothetical protein